MPTLVNICGPGRTGSTVLDLMLGNGDQAFSCGEVYAYYRPWRRIHFKPSCSCGDPECDIWNRLSKYSESEFHRGVSDALNVEWIIDSSKYLPWIVDNNRWASKNGIKVVNLLTYKNPIELCYSHWKRGRGFNFWRKRFVPYYSRFIELDLPFESVYIGHLIQDPAEKLQTICDVIGMPYYEGKELFWEDEHHYLYGSKGVRTQYEKKGPRKNIKPKYPPDFKDKVEEIKQLVSEDEIINSIMVEIKAREVSNLKHEVKPRSWRNPTIMPPWYYYEAFLRPFRRVFPMSGPVIYEV